MPVIFIMVNKPKKIQNNIFLLNQEDLRGKKIFYLNLIKRQIK